MFRRRMSSFLALLACCACAAALPASASARLNAIVSPSPSSIASVSGAAKFVGATSGRSYNCTSSQLRATLLTATGQAPLTVSSNVAWTFPSSGSCTIVGGLILNFGCTTAENWLVFGVTVSGITAGQAGLDCTVSLAASPTCRVRITGSVPMQFDNLGTVTVPNIGQSLSATGSTCTTLPNDTSVTLSTAAGPSLTYTVSPLFTLSVS